MSFPELTDNELFGVLLCGEKPMGGYTIEDYAEEWNKRCDNGMRYEVQVTPEEEVQDE